MGAHIIFPNTYKSNRRFYFLETQKRLTPVRSFRVYNSHFVQFAQNMLFWYHAYMTVISTSKARNLLPQFIEALKEHDTVFVIGRRNTPEAVLIKFPSHYKKDVSDITNVNAYSSSFDFLADEPELYSVADVIRP